MHEHKKNRPASLQVSGCSPDRIRTGATALRGRRPGPLDDGAVRWCGGAGVPGLEPRLTEPESVGLPITPYPNRGAHLLGAPGDDVSPSPEPTPNRHGRRAAGPASGP